MGARLQDFEANRDRNNPRKTAELFNLILPNSQVRLRVLSRIANSIRVADRRASASWAITQFDWGIRLNVGQVMVLQVSNDEFSTCERASRGRQFYAAVPVSSRFVQRTPIEAASLSADNWQAHERFIEDAADAKRRSPFKNAFSEGVLKYLEGELHTHLPRPPYLEHLGTTLAFSSDTDFSVLVPATEKDLFEIEKIEQDLNLNATQKKALVLARVGQGQFRNDLIEMWGGCAVTGCKVIDVMRASHIKAWSVCKTSTERLDKFNGLLLSPNLDALFDKALISFDEKGRILISGHLAARERANLGITEEMEFAIKPKHQPFLRYHRRMFDKKIKRC